MQRAHPKSFVPLFLCGEKISSDFGVESLDAANTTPATPTAAKPSSHGRGVGRAGVTVSPTARGGTDRALGDPVVFASDGSSVSEWEIANWIFRGCHAT